MSDTFEGSEWSRRKYASLDCTGTPELVTQEMEVCTGGDNYNSVYGSSEYTSTSSSRITTTTSKLKSCFAGSETLHLESGEVKSISDIRVGERVLAADAAGQTSYSDVVFVPHGANNDVALFTHITTASGRDIKMTPSHIILAGPCHSIGPLPLSYASSVSVGDCVMTVSGKDVVSTVETVQGKGLYTVVAKEE